MQTWQCCSRLLAAVAVQLPRLSDGDAGAAGGATWQGELQGCIKEAECILVSLNFLTYLTCAAGIDTLHARLEGVEQGANQATLTQLWKYTANFLACLRDSHLLEHSARVQVLLAEVLQRAPRGACPSGCFPHSTSTRLMVHMIIRQLHGIAHLERAAAAGPSPPAGGAAGHWCMGCGPLHIKHEWTLWQFVLLQPSLL